MSTLFLYFLKKFFSSYYIRLYKAINEAFSYYLKGSAIREGILEFFIKQPLVALGQGALSAGIMQGLANAVGMAKQKHANNQIGAIEAGRYLLTTDAQEFDDLSPEAQKIVRKEFADRPQEPQAFIQKKSPDGSVSKDAQAAIDAAADAIYGKKKMVLGGVNTKVSATMPLGTKITADTNGVVAVDVPFTPDVAKVTGVLGESTGLKFGYAEYYQNGKKNNGYNGHYDPTTNTINFRKGASRADVDNLVRTDYTFAQRILDIIDSFIYYFNERFGRLEGDVKTRADLEQARRKYRLALASAKGMRGSGGNISYDIKMHYRRQVDLALEKKFKSGLSVYIGKPSKFLSKIGLDPDLPMLMNQSHLRDINHPKSKENRHWHGLSGEIIKQIPDELKNPVMVYDSISPNNAENSVCVVTSLKDADGLPIIVSIRVEGYGQNRYLNVEANEQTSLGANFVTSAYGREEFFAHIENVLQNDALIYANKNKTHRLFSGSELELLTRLNNLGFDKIIHPSRNIVKSENKNSFSFSSPKTDTDTFDTDVPMRHIDGSVRTYAEYQAEEAAEPSAAKTQQDFTPAPGTKKPPMES